MGTLTYDFESDTVGNMPSGWAHLYGTVGCFTVGQPGGKNLQARDGGVAGTIEIIKCTDAGGSIEDAVVEGTFNTKDANSSFGVWLRQTGDAEDDGYLCFFSPPTNQIIIYEFTNTVLTSTIDTASVTMSHGVDTQFKAECTGTTIRAKAWTGAEPGWQASGTDNSFSSGWICLASQGAVSSDVDFDDISITSDSLDTDVDATLGAVAVAGYNPKLGIPLNVSATLGTVSAAGFNPTVMSSILPNAGAVTIAGYNPSLAASAPQVELKFKFKDSSDVVRTRSIVGRPSVQSVSADVFADTIEDVVLMDASGGNRTVYLPTASGRTGFIYRVKKTDSSSNTVTLSPAGAETIDGAASFDLEFEDESVTIASDGTNWIII